MPAAGGCGLVDSSHIRQIATPRLAIRPSHKPSVAVGVGIPRDITLPAMPAVRDVRRADLPLRAHPVKAILAKPGSPHVPATVSITTGTVSTAATVTSVMNGAVNTG